MAPVEAILDRVATRLTDLATPSEARPPANRALWICGCYAMDDSPIWLIYDEPGGAIRWCRIPAGSEACDIVDPRFVAGGHTHPASVLRWLQGADPDPWSGGDGWDDDEVVLELSRKVVRP